MNKFFITKTIDYETLNKQISIFIYKNETTPYIFVNEKTLDLMGNNIEKMTYDTNSGMSVYTYLDLKVYINLDLEDGEVELR